MGKAKVITLTIPKKRRKDTGKGAKKYGRHKSHCLKYKAEGRREKNKARKQRKIQKMLAKKKARLLKRV